MKTFQIEAVDGNCQCVVEDSQVASMAYILETSAAVNSFHVQGLNVVSQQRTYNVSGYRKWNNPIQQ